MGSIGCHSKSKYAQLHRFSEPLPLARFLPLQGTPSPESTYFQVLTPPPKHLLLLPISVISKFATFDTYLKKH